MWKCSGEQTTDAELQVLTGSEEKVWCDPTAVRWRALRAFHLQRCCSFSASAPHQHLKVTLGGHPPVGQSSSEVALDVGVHDRFEVLEFAVLEEVDDVDLETSRKHHFNRDNSAQSHEPAPQGSLGNFNTNKKFNTGQ